MRSQTWASASSFACRLDGFTAGERLRSCVIQEDVRVQLLLRLPHAERSQLKWIRQLVKVPSKGAIRFLIQDVLKRILYISNWFGCAWEPHRKSLKEWLCNCNPVLNEQLLAAIRDEWMEGGISHYIKINHTTFNITSISLKRFSVMRMQYLNTIWIVCCLYLLLLICVVLGQCGQSSKSYFLYSKKSHSAFTVSENSGKCLL